MKSSQGLLEGADGKAIRRGWMEWCTEGQSVNFSSFSMRSSSKTRSLVSRSPPSSGIVRSVRGAVSPSLWLSLSVMSLLYLPPPTLL